MVVSKKALALLGLLLLWPWPEANAGWRLVGYTADYTHVRAFDGHGMPPKGGTASVEVEAAGRAVVGEARAYDYSVLGSVSVDRVACGLYFEYWKYRSEHQYEGVAEFRGRVDISGTAAVISTPALAISEGYSELTVRAGGQLFFVHVDVYHMPVSAGGGGSVSVGCGPVTVSPPVPGKVCGGGTSVGGTPVTDEFAGDLCGIVTYTQKHRTKGRLLASANGCFGPAQCRASVKGTADMLYRCLTEVPQCP